MRSIAISTMAPDLDSIEGTSFAVLVRWPTGQWRNMRSAETLDEARKFRDEVLEDDPDKQLRIVMVTTIEMGNRKEAEE